MIGMNIEEFLRIEKKYNLYEQSIDNVQYWTYARFSIWNYKICTEHLGLEESHKKKQQSIIEIMKTALSLLYYSIFKGKVKRNVDILFLNHERRVKNHQYYECVYTEKLSQYYTNSATLERPYEYRHFKPVRTRNLIHMDYCIVKGHLYYRISKILKTKHYQHVRSLVKQQIEIPLEEMKKAYSWKCNNNEIYEFLVEKVMHYKKEYSFYSKLLDKLNPKVIVEVVHYCMQNMIINELAKKKGISAIELQHGTMHSEHAAYQYAEGVKIKQLPEKMFLFADFWQEEIRVPIDKHSLISTGYPLFEEKRVLYSNKKRNDTRKTLLFLSQGTIGIYLSKLAVSVAQLSSPEEYRIIFKLHPCEYQTWHESYPELQNSQIEVIDNNIESIYAYFAMSDIQIGVYSTAIYEGLGFGLQTLILRVGHYEVMQSLVDVGCAAFVDCAEDVIEFMKIKSELNVAASYFWKPNALDNMVNEIDKMLSKM